jgi:hypothetical protein
VYGGPVFGLEDPSILSRDTLIDKEETLGALRKLPNFDEETLSLLRTFLYFVRDFPHIQRKPLTP